MAQFADMLKSGINLPSKTITKTYLWFKKQYNALGNKITSKYQARINQIEDLIGTKIDTVVKRALTPEEYQQLQIPINALSDTQKAVDHILLL